MRTATTIFIAAALLLLASCSNSNDECNTDFNQAFKIKEGQTFCLADETTVHVDLIGNNYCPCNVQCIWAGETFVELTHTLANGTAESVILHEIMEDQNPSWADISFVKTDEECTPVTTEVRIIVYNN
jgi:hypothetical protein